MSLEQNTNLGQGGAGFQGDGAGSAAKMIRELQGLQFTVVTGGAAAAGLTLTGIDVGDTIAAVINLADSVNQDVDDITIAEDEITFATETTTGDALLVIWYPKPA